MESNGLRQLHVVIVIDSRMGHNDRLDKNDDPVYHTISTLIHKY